MTTVGRYLMFALDLDHQAQSFHQGPHPIPTNPITFLAELFHLSADFQKTRRKSVKIFTLGCDDSDEKRGGCGISERIFFIVP